MKHSISNQAMPLFFMPFSQRRNFMLSFFVLLIYETEKLVRYIFNKIKQKKKLI